MELSDEAKADIANHLKWGFSVAGIKTSQRSAYTVVDGIWSTAAYRPLINPVNACQNPARGQFSFKIDDNMFNYAGEKKALADTTDGDGYIYDILMTFNFGKIAELDSFGFYVDAEAQYIAAADIYVSDNGSDWTLVGYYDHETKRILGVKPEYASSKGLGKDGAGTTIADKNVVLFELPEGTEGQFLRIASTTGVGKASTSENWGEGLVGRGGVGHCFNEMFVFGTLTDDVGYEMPDDQQQPTDTQPTETQAPAPIVTKPATTQPQQTPTTQAPTQGTDDADASATEEAGCASAIGAGMSMMAILSAGGLLLVKRKKHS